MPTYQANQALPEEIKQSRERCGWSNCKCKVRFEDWTGSRFCTSHMWFIFKNSENKLFNLKNIKII